MKGEEGTIREEEERGGEERGEEESSILLLFLGRFTSHILQTP